MRSLAVRMAGPAIAEVLEGARTGPVLSLNLGVGPAVGLACSEAVPTLMALLLPLASNRPGALSPRLASRPCPVLMASTHYCRPSAQCAGGIPSRHPHHHGRPPLLQAISLVREIEVSHWGNIYVEDTYELVGMSWVRGYEFTGRSGINSVV